jgi:Ca-activated chloride channel homolog
MQGLTIMLKRSASIALSLLATLAVSSNTLCPLPALAAGGDPRLILSPNQPGTKDKQKFSGEGSGTLLAMLGSGKQLGQCPLKHTDVKASVAGYVSRVSVKQTFQNSFKEKIEAIYTFPLPENAAVDEMTMKIGDRIIKGNIKRREEAKEIYEKAKAEGHVASLLDQERPNIFTQSVANIEPGAQVEIEIKYVEMLPYEAGSYSFFFPTVVGPRFIPGSTATGKSGRGRLPDTDAVGDASRITPQVAPQGQRAGHDISIAVDINAGVPINSVNSQLHEVNVKKEGMTAHVSLVDKSTIPNKDFVLRWEVAGDKIQSGYLTHSDDKSGYFTLMLMPPKKVQAEEVSPKEMVFLVDCSGSQSGAPLQKAKETLEYILDHMNANDTFQIIAFSNTQIQLADHSLAASPEMKRRAMTFIKKLEANGGTWMAPAVEKVCALPNDEHRLRIVTFMTDGYVGNDMEILGLVKKYRNKSRWFPFGTGNSVNRFLIDGIAREGGGEADYVLLNSPGAVVGAKFYKRISTPLLTDVKLDYDGLEVKEVFPHELSDVWAEKPLYIKGRYLKSGAGTITLSGFAGGKPYRQELKVNFPEKQSANEVIKPMWARAKVDRLMSEDWLGAQRGAINKELKEEIIKTALEYHIMTEYTSFVAVEEKRVTKGGVSKTVDVPVEIPDGVSRATTINDARDAGAAGAMSPPSLPPPPLPSMGFTGGFASANGGVSRYRAPSKGTYSSPSSFAVRGTLTEKKEMAGNPYHARPRVSAEADASSSGDEESESPATTSSLKKLDLLLIQLLNAEKNGVPARIEGVDVSGGKVLVKVTLTDVSEATLQKLKALGLEVLVTNPGEKTIIARIKIRGLEELSNQSTVIKIEPTKMSK